MYITTYSSTALRRASRTKFLSSSPSLSTTAAFCSSSRAHSSPSITNQCRSFSFSSAFRSVPRWSHGVDWKSLASLTSSEGSPPWVLFVIFIAFLGLFLLNSSECDFKGILTGLPKPEGGDTQQNLIYLNTMKIVQQIDWKNTSLKQVEIPFEHTHMYPTSKTLLLCRDFTGLPAVVDLACMHDVPVDLVTNHSLEVDVARSENAVQANMKLEFQRNKGRFAFLKWGSNAFQNMLVVPVSSGFVHQVNLEYLGRVVFNIDGMLYPDSVVGTDFHTTMIDGLVVAGWGVGATDLVLTVTQMLRKHGVIGKFVEFYGEGVGKISLVDRATIGNMSSKYGATMGFFPVDHVTLQYLKLTGRSEETMSTFPHSCVAMIEAYLRANNMFVDYDKTRLSPQQEGVYSSYLHLDLADVPLKKMKVDWHSCLDNKIGFKPVELNHGSVITVAITSCTNTSNPSVMLGAGLVTKKTCELGLQVKSWIKTSLAPGSGVVTKYLLPSGLQKYLNEQGFHIVGYGCTTCIGNSRDMDESIASNFEGHAHPLTRANYVASHSLVVAYALARTSRCPIARTNLGKDFWVSTSLLFLESVNFAKKKLKSSSSVSLGEEVCKLQSRRDERKRDRGRLQMLANEVTINLNVFHPLMEDSIVGNSTAVVTIERDVGFLPHKDLQLYGQSQSASWIPDPDFFTLASQLARLTRKGVKFVWSESYEKSLELIILERGLGYTVYCNASRKGLRCVLMQGGK
ncbi:hypothetical protein LOK49_LG09G01572, partial [Camellia lanceoleosa]